MSDFHDALRRAAQQHGEAVAPSLTADAVVASSVHGISRGWRRRATAQAGVAVLGVTAIGMAAWLVPSLGGVWDAEPAGADAGPFRYSVESGGDVRDSEPEVMLRGADAVMCGDELDLTPGLTVHDAQALDRDLFLEAELTTLGDTLGTPTAEPRPLDPDDPDGIMTGWDPDSPSWRIAGGGEVRSYRVATLLMDDDIVAGVVASSAYGAGGDEDAMLMGESGAGIPRIGQCDDSLDSWSNDPGDPMDTRLVAQYWSTSETGESTLLATVVVDPNEPANSSEAPGIDGDSPDVVDSAELSRTRPTHQAFAVPRPEPGCSPLTDLRDAGHPSTDAPEYTVRLPFLTEELTGELWGDEWVVSVTGGDTPWYLEHHAWLVADEVSAGIPDPHLQWHPGLQFILRSGGTDPLRGDDCAYDAPIPEIDGAVFLVIDGVDWDAVDEAGTDPGGDRDGYQTWVYLGEAD
ncbi:hypothetical protein [Demequina muriae]|uniref:Uncharacterized protein n=1 Tax=Demequina muriae TaxID=3051664 RepID=A0ABT8GFI0_9MICO|nr:hypothetical protein [Demequina sp. EGI L300058]MDN4480191.1 hypothetical protein [Demequina sp. EGI L300058]